MSLSVISVICPLAGCFTGAQEWMDGYKENTKLQTQEGSSVLYQGGEAITLGGTCTCPPAAAEQTANINF